VPEDLSLRLKDLSSTSIEQRLFSMASNGQVATKAPANNLLPEELIHDPVSSGPWGGEGGLSWDDGVYTAIRQIVIFSGRAIDSITIEYDKNGVSHWSARHGGLGGFETHKIPLDYPDERLLCISGYSGAFFPNGPVAIRSLTFSTNRRKYGPFGVEEGTFFESPTLGSRIVGFHGRSGLYLDGIGVYTQMFVQCCAGNRDCQASKMLPKVISAVRDIVEAVKVRPSPASSQGDSIYREVYTAVNWKPVPSVKWGGQGGNPWDDGVYSGIRQIAIAYGDAVDSITFQYDRNGDSIWSVRHGGLGGTKKQTVRFDYPDEFLTSINGYYGHFGPSKPLAVRSLTFQTNRGKYGPYGQEIGTFFSTPTSGRKILGFHGRSGWYLDAIGVHLIVEHPIDEGNKEEVENAWKEFVSRVVHHKVLVESNGDN